MKKKDKEYDGTKSYMEMIEQNLISIKETNQNCICRDCRKKLSKEAVGEKWK